MSARRNTAAFAVESVRRWWHLIGEDAYPHAGRLLVTCDAAGPTNCAAGPGRRAWRNWRRRRAGGHGVPFPPGTSKWNKIEHRLFSQITLAWRGRPLTSHDVIVSTIGAVKTATGLTATAVLDRNSYPAGTRVSDEQMRDLEDRALIRHAFHGEWNYACPPRPPPAPAPRRAGPRPAVRPRRPEPPRADRPAPRGLARPDRRPGHPVPRPARAAPHTRHRRPRIRASGAAATTARSTSRATSWPPPSAATCTRPSTSSPPCSAPTAPPSATPSASPRPCSPPCPPASTRPPPRPPHPPAHPGRPAPLRRPSRHHHPRPAQPHHPA